MKVPSVDVVIVNFRNAALVAEAVQRLRPHGTAWPYGHIYIVDNSADAEHTSALRSRMQPLMHHHDIRVMVMAYNLGFGNGCNAAWERSTAEFVLLLNPDARIEPDAVHRLATTLAAAEQYAGMSPRTWWDRPGGWVLPLPTPQDTWGRLRRAWASRWSPQGWACHQARNTANLMTRNTIIDAETLAGAVLLLRRSAVMAVGGLFSKDFFMYFEDAELCRRLCDGGWRLAIDPTVDAVHHWRHEPHKAPLMAQAETVFRRGFPAWYQLAQRLWPRLEATGCVSTEQLVLRTASEAAQKLGPVAAISPLPCGDPSWVRSGLAFQVLSSHDWGLLAPGPYWAWTADGWRGFTRESMN